jgi:hypothetical protein
MLQRTLYGQQIEAQMKKAYGDKDEDEIASGIFKTVFQDAGYDPETGGFLPVAASGQELGSSPMSGTPITQDDFTAPKPANPMDSILDELGWSAGRKKFFMSQYKADPKAAMKNLERSYIEFDRSNRKGKTEARDVLAKEKAIAEAMGIPVGEYMQQRMNKTGVNVTVPVNVMTGEAQEASGRKEGMEIGEQAAMIENKYSAIDSIREARDILTKGIYSGYWGDMGKTVAKASMGAIGDRQKAARTEEFMSYIGNTVVPRLKEFGGNDSNEEMRYLQKIMGGDTSMEPEAISKILESAERKIARGIERLQRQRGALEQGRMPDLGPGPSRNQPKPAAKPTVNVKKPSVSNW